MRGAICYNCSHPFDKNLVMLLKKAMESERFDGLDQDVKNELASG